MTEKETGVAAVDRALSILDVFRPDERPLTLHEISARTRMYKSTILRLIATLERHGCLQRIGDGRYQLGPKLLHWGRIYQTSLRLEDHVLPVLQRLVHETSEGASFFIREGQLRLCLFRVDSPRAVRDHVHAGDLLPLDRGCAGRVLLMFDPTTPAEEVPNSPIVASFGEREPEIAAVAVPVFGPANSLKGALAVSGPKVRFTDKVVSQISASLLDAAVELTGRLGGDQSKLRPAQNSAQHMSMPGPSGPTAS